MKCIKENQENTMIINKSKFICLLIKLNSLDEIKNTLVDIKNKYKDATHYCYGYIFDSAKRFNDDGEPNGTAGIPILNVLENNNLDHILCVVIRYFGGIKLGAGGLVRAYSSSVVEALKNSKIIELKQGKLIEITFNYENTKEIDYLLKDFYIDEKIYNLNINYIFKISDDDFNNIKDKLKELCVNINIKEDIYI